MQSLAISGALAAPIVRNAQTSRGRDACKFARSRTENKLCEKQNDLLDRWIEPGSDLSVDTADVAIDNADYEFVGLKMHNEKAMPRLAVMIKERNKRFPLAMRGYRLIATNCTVKASEALALNGKIESPLLEVVRAVVPVNFDRGLCPASMKRIPAIHLGTRWGRGSRAHSVIPKGNFPVEGRYSFMRETVSCPAAGEYVRLASGLLRPLRRSGS